MSQPNPCDKHKSYHMLSWSTAAVPVVCLMCQVLILSDTLTRRVMNDC